MFAIGWYVKSLCGRPVNDYHYVGGFSPRRGQLPIIRMVKADGALKFSDRKDAEGLRALLLGQYPKLQVRSIP